MPDMTMSKDEPLTSNFHNYSTAEHATSIYVEAADLAANNKDICEGLRARFDKVAMEDRPNFRRGCLEAIENFKLGGEGEKEIIAALEKLAADIGAVKQPGKTEKIIREARGLHNV